MEKINICVVYDLSLGAVSVGSDVSRCREQIRQCRGMHVILADPRKSVEAINYPSIFTPKHECYSCQRVL